MCRDRWLLNGYPADTAALLLESGLRCPSAKLAVRLSNATGRNTRGQQRSPSSTAHGPWTGSNSCLTEKFLSRCGGDQSHLSDHEQQRMATTKLMTRSNVGGLDVALPDLPSTSTSDGRAYGFIPAQVWICLQAQVEALLQQSSDLCGLSTDVVKAFNKIGRQQMLLFGAPHWSHVHRMLTMLVSLPALLPIN